jgi:hypothetical protein
MKPLQRLPIAIVFLALASGTAIAGSISSVSNLVTFATDGSYTLTLAKFDPTICGAPGCTLNGATLYFFGSEDVSTLTLTNRSLGAEIFDLFDTSNLNFNSGNSANAADTYSGQALDLFDTGLGPNKAQYPTVAGALTLGGTPTTPVCPEYTPSSACNSVSYTGPDIVVNNTDAVYGFPTGVGLGGVDGVTMSLSSADANANYLGASTFTLTGGTKDHATFSGGGGQIDVDLLASATFQAEIDYNYTVNASTPEPATMVLMGGALLGLGSLGKRLRKSWKSR